MQKKQAPFGFRDVPEQEKATLVRGVFDRVANRYDLMNDLMSLGAHRVWKEALVDALLAYSPSPRGLPTLKLRHPAVQVPAEALGVGGRELEGGGAECYAAPPSQPSPAKGGRSFQLLDLAGGTGDISLRVLKRAPDAQITLADINAAMLQEGRKRNAANIARVCGDAEALPFPDKHFDACVISFGLRNVTHTEAALREIFRVLKTGGHFLCLEFSQVTHEWLRPAYDWYSFNVIPRIGRAVAGDGEPYKYLVESIRRFPLPDKLAAMMREAGFGRVTWRPISGGVVALHSGWRI